MKKIALSLVIISSTLIINSAYAGEMGKINALTEWTGLYAGINAGYIFPNNKNVNVDPYLISSASLSTVIAAATGVASAVSATNSFSLNNGGFISGGQLGYIRNFHNNLVAGLEADIQNIAGASQSGTSNSSPPCNVSL